jgi:hypothetical protein
MSDPKDYRFDQREERYMGFANYCLQLAKVATDDYNRAILREMAEEWLKLAEHDRTPEENHFWRNAGGRRRGRPLVRTDPSSLS